MTVVFSGYKSHPEATRVSHYPQFGMPSCTIDGERPSKMTLTGSVEAGMNKVERENLRNWFINKCFMGLNIHEAVVEINTELPEELHQWYMIAEYHKEKQ